jgi:hypothetical protein
MWKLTKIIYQTAANNLQENNWKKYVFSLHICPDFASVSPFHIKILEAFCVSTEIPSLIFNSVMDTKFECSQTYLFSWMSRTKDPE